ncbi:MAG: MATE family efflux transporter [Anaerolineaceae bacterium]|nr:MATE family efflux transporter [Anaerolineaceae bacterium]
MNAIINQIKQDRSFYSKIFTIAVPIIIQSFVMSSLNLIDIIMIGQIGDVAVASVGLANQVYFLLRLLLFGVCSGAAVFAAQYWGQRDIPNIRKVLGLSLILSIASGVLFTILSIIFPEWVLGLYTTDQEVIRQGSMYLRIVGLSYIVTAISFAYSMVLRSVERVNLPMMVSIIALVINTILNYGLILGKLGMPEMGIEGAAIGTTVARGIEFIAIIFFTYRLRTPAAARIREMWGYSTEFFKTFMKTTGPVIINEILWSLGSTMYFVIYARMNTTALAAANISSTVQSMALVFLIGIANGCAIIVGNQIGAGHEDTAFEYSKKSIQLNIVIGVLLGIGLNVLAGPILGLYKVTEETAFIATRMIQIQGYAFWLKGICMLLIVGIMRSGGDTRYSAVIDVGAIWLVGVPLGAIAAFVFHLPAYLVGLVFVSEDVVKAIFGMKRFISKKWINNLATTETISES